MTERGRRRSRAILLLICVIACHALAGSVAAARARQSAPPQLLREDAVVIAEAYNLWQKLGEKLWAGWTQVQMPIIYITEDYEYAVGFQKALNGFTPLPANEWLAKPIQARKRVLGTHLSASFDYQDISTVVVGTPKALEKSPASWVLMVTHEMFHVLQASRGQNQKVAQLKIGPENDPSWQLNFAFPYKDADIMRLMHLQGYPMYLAVTEKDEAALKYNAGTAVEAIRVYRSLLRQKSPEGKLYDYSKFQELSEGVGLYTEYKMAELAAAGDYQPTDAFRRLPNYKSYQQAWEEDYANRIFLVKHAGRAAQSRTAFYHLGLGKALLLDRLMPDWRLRYFAPGVWLDDLVFTALGQLSEIPVLTAGSTAPDFSLTDTAGTPVSLRQYRGKVVLLDFWQTWCLPCVEAIPQLKSLQDKYRQQGLVVLGVTDRLDAEGLAALRKATSDYKINYLLLVDEKGATTAQYAVSGYPHVYVIDRNGHLTFDNRGTTSEAELEQEIQKAFNAKPAPSP